MNEGRRIRFTVPDEEDEGTRPSRPIAKDFLESLGAALGIVFVLCLVVVMIAGTWAACRALL